MIGRLLRVAFSSLLAATACTPYATAGETVRGAGATFPAPLYAKWAQAYRLKSGVAIEYAATGSGIGIEQIRIRLVDFGATDAPLSPDELRTAHLIQFPAVIGGVVPVVNIRGIKPGELKLDGAVLADIYLGKITRWNAAPIAALNPALNLPNSKITVVHRSDQSGTTFLWTDYLSKTSADWKTRIGAGKSVAWPTGIGVGGDGNEGVASYVQRTRMSIGYVEYFFAKAHGLSHASVRNRAGEFAQPGSASFRAAANAADWNAEADFFNVPTDQPGKASWPISGASFILLPNVTAAPSRTLAAMQFFRWALTEQADTAEAMDYAALPMPVSAQISRMWTERVRDESGGTIWNSDAARAPAGE